MNCQLETPTTIPRHIAARVAILASFSIVLAGAFPVWMLYAFIFTARLTH